MSSAITHSCMIRLSRSKIEHGKDLISLMGHFELHGYEQ